jgi:hypothetical protein
MVWWFRYSLDIQTVHKRLLEILLLSHEELSVEKAGLDMLTPSKTYQKVNVGDPQFWHVFAPNAKGVFT